MTDKGRRVFVAIRVLEETFNEEEDIDDTTSRLE